MIYVTVKQKRNWIPSQTQGVRMSNCEKTDILKILDLLKLTHNILFRLNIGNSKDGIYEMNLYWNTETLKWSFEVVKKNEFVNMIIESKQYYEIDEQAEDYIAKTFKKYYSILMNNNNRN